MTSTLNERPRPKPRRVAARTYTTTEVLAMTGITFRVLDYWLRSKVIVLSQENRPGSGIPRVYTTAEVEAIGRLVQRYRAANTELETIRSGKAWLDEVVGAA
jgi:DNA-binding transcriptional MerR regulator